MASQWRGRLVAIALVAGLAVPAFSGRTAIADDSVKTSKALQFAPEDASLFVSMMRMKQQIDNVAASKAWAEFKSLPLVQLGWAQAQIQWNSPDAPPQLQQFKEFWKSPENQQLADMLIDAISHEVFFFGDGKHAELLAKFQDVGRTVRKAQVAGDPAATEAAVREAVFSAFEKSIDDIEVPTTVIGFKVSDAQRATTQLARLEQIAIFLSQINPQLNGRVRKEDLGGGSFLTLDLVGSMVPWNELPTQELGELKPRFDALIPKLQKKTLTIALGLRNDYLMLAIGSSPAKIGGLGKGKSLVERPEFAPLVKSPAKPWTSITYVSEAFSKASGGPAAQFDQFQDMADQFVPLSPLPENVKKELLSDVRSWIGTLKKLLPQAGASLGYTYLTPRGYESFAYDWGQDSSIDASKPLSILKHVGDAPLLMVAGRSKPQPEGYELLASVVPRAFYYAQQVNEFGADPEQAAKLKKVAEEFGPLLKKFDKITRDSLQPALADGQAALVVDAKTTHKQWHSEMPESAKPLALPSPALVVGVKDSAKLQQAAEGYFGLLQEALDKLHKLDPENVPEFKIPAPQSRDFPTGKIYYYSLPEEAGLAKIVAPNAGLTGEFAVLSLLPQQTRRLLEPSTLTAGGPLANVDRPLAAAAIVDFAGMIDLLGAWLDYGTNLAPPEAQLGLAQVPSILPLLKCWRGATAVSYKEGTATVTHSESHFADLP